MADLCDHRGRPIEQPEQPKRPFEWVVPDGAIVRGFEGLKPQSQDRLGTTYNEDWRDAATPRAQR